LRFCGGGTKSIFALESVLTQIFLGTDDFVELARRAAVADKDLN